MQYVVMVCDVRAPVLLERSTRDYWLATCACSIQTKKNAYNNFLNRAYSYGENICALHASSLFWVIQMCCDCKCIVAGLFYLNLFRGTANRRSCGSSDDLERDPLIVGSGARKLFGHPKLRIGSSVYGLSAMPSKIGLLKCEDAFMAGWLSYNKTTLHTIHCAHTLAMHIH